MSRPRTARQGGFTLIEVLIVIVIISVMLMIAVPSFVNFTASQRVKTASFDLYAALTFARSEAIKRRKLVIVQPVGGNWKNGWKVKWTENSDDVDCTLGTELRSQDALSGVTFTQSSGFAKSCVVYRLDGRLDRTILAPNTLALGILINPETTNASVQNRCIRVDHIGLPKSTTLTGTTCP